MPIENEILPARGAVIARYRGQITREDVAGSFARFRDHSDFDPAMVHVADLSGFVGTEMQAPEMRALILMYEESYAALGRKLHVLTVAPGDMAYGMSRMFQMLAETGGRIEVEIFGDLACALDRAEALYGGA